MNRKIVKRLVMFFAFVVTALTTYFINSGPPLLDLRSEMALPTLPIVSLRSTETQINVLYGYTASMDARAMRDTITPLPADRRIPLIIDTYGREIDGISYMVRTMDNVRLMEDTQISTYSQSGNRIQTDLALQNIYEPGSEYMLILTLESGEDRIVYYTRVIQEEESYIDHCLGFVREFHEKTFDAENIPWLRPYMEPNNRGDNTTLHMVTINSSLAQLTWRDFSGSVLAPPIPSIKEINPNFVAITLNYVLSSIDESGEQAFYEVEEYFRVNTGSSTGRVFLLDYRRTMNEIFQGEYHRIEARSIYLGIRNPQVDFVTNESGRIVCFAQEGDLWIYDSNVNFLARIFSFREGVERDLRADNSDHRIRIIRVDPVGNAFFAVYGYMSRGNHEGETGTALYYYDSGSRTIQERIFIPSDKSFQILKEDWGRLFYVSDYGYFYLITQGNMYGIDWGNGEENQIFTGMAQENYSISDNNRYLGYSEDGSKIVFMDLEGPVSRDITAGPEEFLASIGFIGTDFVYGISRLSDRSPDGSLPMFRIIIVDRDGQVMKEYERDHVTSAYVENDTVFLQRASRQEDGTYVPLPDDSIKTAEIMSPQLIRTIASNGGNKQTVVSLEGPWNPVTSHPTVTSAKEFTEGFFLSNIGTEETIGDHYFIYLAGQVVFSTTDPAAAIRRADEIAGVVIDQQQGSLWRRGRHSARTLPTSAYLGEVEITALRENQPLPDRRTLNLTGCTVAQVLSFVSNGIPVYAVGEGGAEFQIIAYDNFNVTLLNPANGQTSRRGLQDSEAFFRNAGSIFKVVL